jgi:hypothetical protein
VSCTNSPAAYLTFESPATTEVFTGLANGVTYRFKVAAINDVAVGTTGKIPTP